jgi:hypothetical protein
MIETVLPFIYWAWASPAGRAMSRPRAAPIIAVPVVENLEKRMITSC